MQEIKGERIMIIKARRIRNLDRHLHGFSHGDTIVVGLTDLDRFSEKLQELGFSAEMREGETILPPANAGPVSDYNAEGRFKVHRDQPMETAYRTVEWHWVEWHGWDRVEQSKLVDVPYQRYPRTFIPPPSVELTLASTTDGEQIIRTPTIEYLDENYESLVHIINLFLEIFRECNVLTQNLDQILSVPLRRLNWNILPPGRRPWEQLQREIDPIVRETPEGNQPVIWQRLQTVNSYQPEFLAIGRGGFSGYVIFGFPESNLYVLECIRYGNATYVFEERWEELSQMTKAEILSGNLQRDRIVHLANWSQRLRELMEQE